MLNPPELIHAFASAGMSSAQIIATHHLGAERAARLDRACRWSFPAVLTGLWLFFHRRALGVGSW